MMDGWDSGGSEELDVRWVSPEDDDVRTSGRDAQNADEEDETGEEEISLEEKGKIVAEVFLTIVFLHMVWNHIISLVAII